MDQVDSAMKRLFVLAPWFLVAVLGIPFGVTQWRAHEPASTWFEVKHIYVLPAVEGSPIVINVERLIHKPFYGQWTSTIKEITGYGVAVACTSTGNSDYRPETVLPKPVTLDWWTFPIQCNLKPGQYRIDTVWTFTPPNYPEKSVRHDSNVFTVSIRP